MLSRSLRDRIPLSIRRTLRRAQRFAVDALRVQDLRAPSSQDISGWPLVATVEQAMGTTPGAVSKQHNIALAAGAFSSRPIAHQGLFSFWGWLGEPSGKRGFQDGRALRDGVLIQETGGGLCQLSGALYFAGLQAGLNALERHAHSIDLYTDDTRYTPLGSDATVSFGFKDLRLRNPHSCRVAFSIQVIGQRLRVEVRSERQLPLLPVVFHTDLQPDSTTVVSTFVGGALIARTRYKRLASSATAMSPV